MNHPETCRHENCNRPTLDQSLFCSEHVGAKRRCKRVRVVDGKEQRCKKQALYGLEVCERHGGRFPNSQKMSEKARTLTSMQRFVRPYEGDLDPVRAFEMEFRRCLGRIAWYDEQLAALKSEEDLIWGRTKYESAGGFEGSPNVVYEARINLLEEMQRWERKHLLDMEKVWIGAGLEARKLDLMRSYVDRTFELTERALVALGLDPKDRRVREVMRQVFELPAP